MTKTIVRFLTSAQTKSVFQALNLNSEAGSLSPCPFSIGDTISFPEDEQLAFEVTHRHLAITSSGTEWLVYLRPTHHPLDDESLLRVS